MPPAAENMPGTAAAAAAATKMEEEEATTAARAAARNIFHHSKVINVDDSAPASVLGLDDDALVDGTTLRMGPQEHAQAPQRTPDLGHEAQQRAWDTQRLREGDDDGNVHNIDSDWDLEQEGVATPVLEQAGLWRRFWRRCAAGVVVGSVVFVEVV